MIIDARLLFPFMIFRMTDNTRDNLAISRPRPLRLNKQCPFKPILSTIRLHLRRHITNLLIPFVLPKNHLCNLHASVELTFRIIYSGLWCPRQSLIYSPLFLSIVGHATAPPSNSTLFYASLCSTIANNCHRSIILLLQDMEVMYTRPRCASIVFSFFP